MRSYHETGKIDYGCHGLTGSIATHLLKVLKENLGLYTSLTAAARSIITSYICDSAPGSRHVLPGSNAFYAHESAHQVTIHYASLKSDKQLISPFHSTES